jgi:hypothetical protein
MASMIYEDYKLCPDLKPRECCLVLEQYDEGAFKRLFHAHIPLHRLSESRKLEILKVFVVRYMPLEADAIVSAYINDRGKSPHHEDPFRVHVTYAEPGVQRIYCGLNTKAWIDQVILPSSFRPSRANPVASQ